MRAVSVIDLWRHEHSGDKNSKLQFPTNEEIIEVFKHSSYALTDARDKAGDELITFYKEHAEPIFDSILDDAVHKDLKNDLNYLIFFGGIDDGASIIVTKKKEGQLKLRIWNKKLDEMLCGTQLFFNDMTHLEKIARKCSIMKNYLLKKPLI